MTRKRFNKLRYTLCIQVRHYAEKECNYFEKNKRAHDLRDLPEPVGIRTGETTYQECWDTLRKALHHLPVSKVEK